MKVRGDRVGSGCGNDLKVTIARALKLSSSQRVMSNFTYRYHRDMDEPNFRSFYCQRNPAANTAARHDTKILSTN